MSSGAKMDDVFNGPLTGWRDKALHRDFKVTRVLLIRSTHLSLNVQLLDDPSWTIEGIAERGKRLADGAARCYPGPPVSD